MLFWSEVCIVSYDGVSPKTVFCTDFDYFVLFFSEQLALHLHEEEQRHAQSAVPVAALSRDHTRPYAHAQPATVDRNKKGSVSVNAI
jgi:hypothetical protein